MDAAELRERITKRLLDEIEELQYPSTTMLDRVEERLPDRDAVASYAEILAKKVEGTRFPSISLLNRLDRLASRLEQEEQRERRRELTASSSR